MANPYISHYGKNTQFKPGQSGNPKGRPKGSRNRKTLLRELTQQYSMEWSKIPIKNVEQLAARYDYPIDAIICVAFAKALEGDVRAMRWITETAYGKPKNGLIGDEDDEERPLPPPIYGGLSVESLKPDYGDPQYSIIPDKQ
jgi:hypothetical protein